MTTLYASTFADSLNRLSAQEQKQVKVTTFDLILDPKGNGLQLHRVDKAPGFWTARVSRDIRIVLHKDGDRTLLAWVGHHDDAYRWAERKRLIKHERTGAMQFVEVAVAESSRLTDALRGGVEGPALTRLAGASATAPTRMVTLHANSHSPAFRHQPFRDLTDDALLDVGVPRSWLGAVRATEGDTVEELFELLPGEAAEALLDFATGGRLEDHVAPKAEAGADPFAHPDSQRRFRVLDNFEELQAALDQPFEKWAVFLHPVQRALAERDWKGPVRVTGSAGTGKTIVALHRAVHLAQEDKEARVLLATFSKPLATALGRKRDILTEAHPELRHRVTVRALDQAVMELYGERFGKPNRATASQVRALIRDARDKGLGDALSPTFLFDEWTDLVDAWNVADADSYAGVPRIGRKTRLGPLQRGAAWAVFAYVRQCLAERKLVTWPQIYSRLGDWLAEGGKLPFTHVVLDEAQDLSVAQVRLLARVGSARPDALFLAGDIGQRIFHLPFSWARLGVDIRGRSHCLKVNYRTSHQIRVAADRLLPPAITDMDGIEDGRRGTVSVFDGPPPQVVVAEDERDECEQVAAFLRAWLNDGIVPHEIGLLVRGEGQLDRARAAAKAAGIDAYDEDGIIVAPMHGAKGLEFRAVAVMACDEDVIPDQRRLSDVGDMADLESVYETERHLLYVACTRARDRLMVSAKSPGSEFLDDLRVSSTAPDPRTVPRA